ncbi:sensor histidine kinase [Foetidibacter luteolus]|uniref:sensor histidine kinase n=1 Tax=Foetidibacter luteolus TaxID=2608880 RepID=UPI00129ACEB5|nr:ATP-binding protein [Foetidibacter luteolus]
MRAFYKRNQLKIITIVYWFLLLYIVAALILWFVELTQQNDYMASMRLVELNKDDPDYLSKYSHILDLRKRKTFQYVGEGATFLILILVCAVFVYRAVRRQIKLSHQQQNFMMAVTHELKTPIAVTRLNLETLQKRRLEEEKQQKLIANTLQEANRLNSLCNNILVASQLDAGHYQLNRQEINLSNIVEDSIKDFAERFTGRRFICNIQPGIYTEGESLLLQMLVNNLVDNAIKYSPKDSTVTIALEQNNNSLLFSVADEGEGIPGEEKKKVFEKFYRVGDEATRKAKGTGLGLYLCKRIVKDHKGSIAIKDNQPGGTVFIVTLSALKTA